jgi:hypothetical protein
MYANMPDNRLLPPTGRPQPALPPEK